jgi:predicted acylesterase/phospholipase RssA
MSWLDDWRPEILCLGAGGIKGLDELGAIWWFWLNGNLEKLHSYIGSSIGGIICALLAMGWLPHQILEYAIDAELFKDVSELPVTQVVHEFGIVSNKSFDDALGKKLGDMIIKKLGKIPTLLEFYEKTQKRVVFVIVSLKGEKLLYADHKSHPDMNLMTALRSTSNTPFIFGKLEHQKDFLVDGAIMDPFPVNYLDDGKTPILGIGVSDQREWNYTKMNAINYYDRIASLALKRLTDFAITNMSDACYALILPVADGAGLLKMGSRESRLEKFLAGYKNTEIHVARFPHKMKPKEKETGDPPISMDLLRTCFKTHSAQLILRAMKENPNMFEECLKEVKVEWKPPKEVIPEVQKDEHREIIVHPNAPPDEEEEEILEIPREAFRPAFQPFAREPRSYDFPFPMPRMGVMINLSMDPYILDRLYETILEGIGLIRLTSSSSFGLKKI